MSDNGPPSLPPSLSPSAPPPTLAPEDEFAGIRTRAGRHPALALAADALALFIIFHVRADITSALSSTDPIDLGDAAATFAGGPATTTLPPSSPAPGPISITQSLPETTLISCSTTITVLPATTNARN